MEQGYLSFLGIPLRYNECGQTVHSLEISKDEIRFEYKKHLRE